MNLGSQSISNQSEGFGDYRYQKALKQISKLINVNRQIKLQSQRFRQQNDELQNRLQQVIQHNHNLQNQLELISNEYELLSQNYAQLEDYCKKTEYQQKQIISNNQLQSVQKAQLQQKHSQEIDELSTRFQSQMNQLVTQIQSRQNTISQLQLNTQHIQQLENLNHQLTQNHQKAVSQNQQLQTTIQLLNSQIAALSLKINPHPNEDLLNKLRINEEWIKSLNEQNYSLKQKVLQQQYKKEKQKCNETIFQDLVKNTQSSLLNSISGTAANDLLIRQYAKQVQKKIKKLEDQKNKLDHKYTKLKTKNHQLELKSKTLQKQVNLLIVKLNGYEQLTERQQKQIQKMIEEYYKEMDRVALKSKKKIPPVKHLQEQNHNSTNNRQNQLKTVIENLQRQIQQLKCITEQKNSFIRFLEQKISALQEERVQIQKTNQWLQQQLSSYQNMDLSKTSKNYNKAQTMLKTQPLSKNGSKVFVINGKKYETVVLKNKSEQNNEPSKLANRNANTDVLKRKNGQIEYVSSSRNYGNGQQQLINVQRA